MKSIAKFAPVLICALIAAPVAALAQAPAAPAAPPAPTAPLAVPNPSYDTLVLTIDVNKPAAVVWAKIGKYCDIEAWLGMKCVMTSGKAGEIGSVRTLNGATIEMLAGKTDLSYTYVQPVRQGVPYNNYHGTLEAKPLTATTTKIIYSFVYDGSLMGDQAARDAAKATRAARFNPALAKMKAIAEAN